MSGNQNEPTLSQQNLKNVIQKYNSGLDEYCALIFTYDDVQKQQTIDKDYARAEIYYQNHIDAYNSQYGSNFKIVFQRDSFFQDRQEYFRLRVSLAPQLKRIPKRRGAEKNLEVNAEDNIQMNFSVGGGGGTPHKPCGPTPGKNITEADAEGQTSIC